MLLAPVKTLLLPARAATLRGRADTSRGAGGARDRGTRLQDRRTCSPVLSTLEVRLCQ